jgi:hypothetical protein
MGLAITKQGGSRLGQDSSSLGRDGSSLGPDTTPGAQPASLSLAELTAPPGLMLARCCCGLLWGMRNANPRTSSHIMGCDVYRQPPASGLYRCGL